MPTRGSKLGITKAPDDDWITQTRRVWAQKPALRDYYQTQIFERILAHMRQGDTVQLGTGPGFFSEYHPGMLNSDITDYDGVDVVADVHSLQFDDARFDNIVGIDVLHHFAKPGVALRECARILRPGGRLILVEPWTGPLGWLFYKYVHHEDCVAVLDPWSDAFPGDKKPMDGNSAIPYTVLHKRASELDTEVPSLRIIKHQCFGGLSFILTGGFQSIGLSTPITKFFYTLENQLPQFFMSTFALRAIFVLEKRIRI